MLILAQMGLSGAPWPPVCWPPGAGGGARPGAGGAAGRGRRAPARVGAVAPHTGRGWWVEAAAQLNAFAASSLCAGPGRQ